MHSQSSNLRGIALMVLATLLFTANDTLLKLSTQGLPPFEAIFLRGVFGSLWCLPLVLVSGHAKKLNLVFDPWVALRTGMEFVAVLCFVVALARMPIADISAIEQISPMLLLIGVALIYKEKIGRLRMVLIFLGFLGALLVAQPGGAGYTPYVLLAFASAIGVVARDLIGRRVATDVPALVVAFSTLVLVMAGAGVATFVFERWVMPDFYNLLLVAGAGLVLAIGHLLLFLAYRAGTAAAVAPFSYMVMVWATLSGVLVFNAFPDPLALTGIGLVLVSGVAIVLLDEHHRRLTIIA